MKKDYANAYSEVLEILKYIPKEDYDKVPIKTIQLFKANCNEKSEFTYNAAIPFEKQNISKDAKIILSILYRNCWISEEEKMKLLKEEKQHMNDVENKRRERYNPDKLFNKREKEINKELIENHYMIVQEKWYKKLLNIVKRIFNKK